MVYWLRSNIGIGGSHYWNKIKQLKINKKGKKRLSCLTIPIICYGVKLISNKNSFSPSFDTTTSPIGTKLLVDIMPQSIMIH